MQNKNKMELFIDLTIALLMLSPCSWKYSSCHFCPFYNVEWCLHLLSPNFKTSWSNCSDYITSASWKICRCETSGKKSHTAALKRSLGFWTWKLKQLLIKVHLKDSCSHTQYIIDSYAWNLYSHANQSHPNKVNTYFLKKEKKYGASLLLDIDAHHRRASNNPEAR